MWVPSKYVRQVYIESGVPAERVVVIPNGINPERFHPDAKPYQLTTKKKFRFLFVGGTIYRKGIDLLLQAYLETFKDSDDVCLIIKDMGGNSFYAGQTFREEIERIRQAKGVPEVEYIEKILSEDEIVGLYTACNAFVHPYRGEGFGLPILEAMACGIPAIVTNGGACLDFCNENNSLLVQANKKISKEKRVGNRPTVDNLWFYEVDINDLKAKMRYAYEHPGEIRTLGKEISPDIRNNWTWEMSANKIKERIEYLRKVPVLRYTKDNLCRQTSSISGEMELLNKADGLFQKGAYQESIDAYKRAIEYHPVFFDAYNNLGLVYASIDKPDEAISILKKAIELNGKEASVFNNLGVLYYKKKMHGEARRCFEKALAIDAGYKEARQNLEKVAKLLS
jgi:tetratricopeptide (TPR) repeat protein